MDRDDVIQLTLSDKTRASRIVSTSASDDSGEVAQQKTTPAICKTVQGLLCLFFAIFPGCTSTGNNNNMIDSGPPDIEDAGDALLDGAIDSDTDSNTADDDTDSNTNEDLEEICTDVVADQCPGSADDHLSQHSGLRPISRCQFQLEDKQVWQTNAERIASLMTVAPAVTLTELATALPRVAPSVSTDINFLANVGGVQTALRFDNEDFNDSAWYPQGITGSADAVASGVIDGRKWLVISSYHKAENDPDNSSNLGARVTFFDITGLNRGEAVQYEHVLLVALGGSADAVEITPVPIHAGGLAWVGDTLFVVDTFRGLRAFDVTALLRADPSQNSVKLLDDGTIAAAGFSFILPEIGRYFLSEESCRHRFSFVSLDRSSTPMALITGEFHGADIAGKLLVWPLSGERLDLDTTGNTLFPNHAFWAQETQLQGVLRYRDRWWLSCSAQHSGGLGDYYETAVNTPSSGRGGIIGPEDLMGDWQASQFWTLGELPGRRYIFSLVRDWTP